MKNNRLAVVWIWFGLPPSYFRLLFKTIESNKDIDVLLFSDHTDAWGVLPRNVHLHPTTLGALRTRIRLILHPGAKLSFAYKICDYRPMYGELFAEELADYEFWGWGDLDVMWGRIRDFLPDDILTSYDKLLQFGALSFVRNSKITNSLFRHAGGLDWREVVQSEAFRGFDETLGIYSIIESSGLPHFYKFNMADIMPYRPWFSERVGTLPNRFLYSIVDGHAFRESWSDGRLEQVPLSYIHFQKRLLPIRGDSKAMRHSFWITPNGFIRRPDQPSLQDFTSACHIWPSTYMAFAKFWACRGIKRLVGTNTLKAVR
jgi:hypothetical protein